MAKRRAKELSESARYELFWSLAEQQRHTLWAAARSQAGNPDDAEDLLSKTLCAAWDSFGEFELGSNFGAWCRTILTNRNTDLARHRRLVPIFSLEQPTLGHDDGPREIPDDSLVPEALVCEVVLDEDLARALEQLPPAWRSAFWAVIVDDESYDQAATRLGCAVGTVRSRVHRARRVLRNYLHRTPVPARSLPRVNGATGLVPETANCR